MKPLVIGIVGPIGAGKGSVAVIFQKEGFTHLSLSDLVREEARRQDKEDYNRKDLQDVGDGLRAKFGGQVLAERAIQKAKEIGTEELVISSIKNPAEINYLRKHSRLVLLGVTATKKIRFQRKRGSSRSDDRDIKTWEDFLKADRRDQGIDQKAYGQKQSACFQKADLVIKNNGSLADLEQEVKKVLEYLPQKEIN